MIVLSFYYKRNVSLNEDYYFNHHIPTHSRKAVLEMGAVKYEVEKILSSGDGSLSPYSFIFNLYFETKGALDAFINHPGVAALKEDINNYYRGEPDIFIGEIVTSFSGEK